MAALLRRRSRPTDVLLRTLCTTTSTPAKPALTSSTVKTRLRQVYNADRAVSLLDTIDAASLSAGSARHALSLAARRLSRSGRSADADALLSSHITASPTEPLLSAILCAYASANLPEKAVVAFRSAAPSLPTPISPLPFNALLSALIRCNRYRRVPVIFAELSKEFSIIPNATSYGILVKAHCMIRQDAKAHELLDQMRGQGIPPTTTIYTTMIDSMYKQKKIEEAETLWKQMLDSGCKPDLVTYNVKAMHYGFQGKHEDVLGVMTEMEAAGVKPDTITYNFLMTGYCKDGKVEEAKVVYNSLGEKGCSANAATFKHMLTELCARKDFDAAIYICKESFRKQKVPDFKTMKGYVEELTKAGRVAEAKQAIADVKKMFPDSLMSGWKKVEKELGLSSDDGEAISQPDCMAEVPPEAQSATDDAPELKDSAAERTVVAEESADETPAPETSSDEEVPRGPA